MTSSRFNEIFNEEVERLMEGGKAFGIQKRGRSNGMDIDGVKKLLGSFINKETSSDKDSAPKKKMKSRKKKGGKKELYDYDEYKKEHKTTTDADTKAISRTVDMDATNISHVAQEIYPDHTEQGAQSQLRKVLKGEREMTDDVASKLSQMIDRGQVAVK